MGRDAGAALMACTVIDYDTRKLLLGHLEETEEQEAQYEEAWEGLQEHDWTWFMHEDAESHYFGIFIHKTDWDYDDDHHIVPVEALWDIDLGAYRAHFVSMINKKAEEHEDPGVKGAFVKLALHVATTEDWKVRLLPQYF